jgi:hypothetical protein
MRNKKMRNDLWEKGLVFGILLMLMWAPFLATTNALVIPGLYPDAPPLIPSGAPANCGYENFENGVDGQQIISSLSGLKFITTNGYMWMYGDARTGAYNLKYPNGAYTCQGNIFAWLGPQQSSGIIDFTEGDASYFSCYVSTYSGAVIDAYTDKGAFLCSSGWAQNNLNTGKMTLLSIDRSPNHDIGYVIIHDSGNYWCIDRIVCDAPNVGIRKHPVPKVVVDSEPIDQIDGIYNINVRLMNLGEESLNDPASHQHGILVQVIGGKIQTSALNKGTFTSYQKDPGPEPSNDDWLEFYVNYLNHNDECSGSFTIKTEQGNKASIGIRAWIFDKDDLVNNPDTGQNEPYIARCPTEDSSPEPSNNKPYSQHLKDPAVFSFLEYRLNYYPLYQHNDFDTNYHSTWLLLGWSYKHTPSTINILLSKLQTQSIHEIYLNIGGIDTSGNFQHSELTKDQVRVNCGIFMDTVNHYTLDNSYDFIVYAWLEGSPYPSPHMSDFDIGDPSVRANIVQLCQDFVSDDVERSIVGFDGIHFNYEFYVDTYKASYLEFLRNIKAAIPSTKYLSVDILSPWLFDPLFQGDDYVHQIAEKSHEIVWMAYVSSRKYEAYANWIMDGIEMMFNQAEKTLSRVIIGVTLQKREPARDCPYFKGERFDYGLVGALMGARENGRTQVDISIWAWDYANSEDWRVFDAIWNPVRTIDVYIFSPVDLHLYDSLGRHVGLNYVTGEIDDEIPGSYYSGPNAEPQRITITNPTDDEFTIMLLGTAQGTYQMKIEGYISDTLVHSEVIDGNTDTGEIHDFGVTIPIEKPYELIVRSGTLDNIPPTTTLTIGNPQYIDGEGEKHITSATPLTLTAEDNVDGTGVASTHYRVYNTTGYDTGLTASTAPIELHLTGIDDGEYSVDFYSVDNMGNVEDTNTQQVVLDNTAPSLTIETPSQCAAVQDGVDFTTSATDLSAVASVMVSIRSAQGDIISLQFELMPATLEQDGKWHLYFNTRQLPDGFYAFVANGTDVLGNWGTNTVKFSIRNWAAIQLLPSTPNSNAGRTMPIKFSIRVKASVDPAQPFIYNKELTIKIYRIASPSNILLQTSIFGSGSTNYRIDTGKLYITNFKTLNAPATYIINIYRKGMLIGSFRFSTVKQQNPI